MTVNLTLNDITANEALKILDLIKQEAGNITEPTVNVAQQSTTAVPHVPPAQSTPVAPLPQSAPIAPPAMQAPTAPINPAVVPSTVPIAPVQQPTIPNYTIEQLQTAIAPLLDAGKVGQIQQLVQSFGVNTLMDIPPARYGEFANGLRSLGGVL